MGRSEPMSDRMSSQTKRQPSQGVRSTVNGETTTEPNSPASGGASGVESASQPLPHGCRCGARWGGSNTAHCAAVGCHRTFAAVGGFDAHRRDGRCLDPATIGMAQVAGRPYQCWGYPADESTTGRLRALRGIG